MGGCARRSPPCSTTPSSRTVRRWWWRTSISPTPGLPGGKPWAAASGGSVSPRRSRYPHREVPHPAHGDGRAPRCRRDRRGCGLYQPVGQPILENPLTAADFRSGHPPSRRGGRDRQTWPRLGDQATAGRTPQRTEDRCGHSTGQAQSSTEPRWRARPFRPTDMHTPRRAGSPENTRPPRPTPLGPHRTHSCSLIRNGGERSPISTAAAGMVTMASTTSHRIPAPATCLRCTHGRACSYGVRTSRLARLANSADDVTS